MNYTILINKNNPWQEKYAKKRTLVETKDINNNPIYIEEKTFEAYKKLKEELLSNNIEINIDSAYRSVEEQKDIYEEFKQTKENYQKLVALPNYSEHHTGLAIDLSINTTENEDTIFKQIHKLLPKYGFILRYPKDKENITSYDYEPWHIRYVGEIPAKIMFEKNLTLEEYHTSFQGILLINKEKGMTSFDVVKKISNYFGLKKVGHTGTLDPLAEGVMIITIGQATKVVELLTAEDKEYIATVKIGIETDTLDIEGIILNKKEPQKITNLKEVLNSFKKTYLQEVPIYSAIKVDGKKLYEYARNNKKVTLPKKEVTIKNIELLDQKEDTFTFKTLVTKGCYIRSLIRDIGKEINEYTTMTSLIRTKQGKISIEETNTLEDIKTNNYKLYSIEDLLDIPKIEVGKDIEKKISYGQKLPNKYHIKDKVIFLNKDKKLLGIYKNKEDILVVWKNFI